MPTLHHRPSFNEDTNRLGAQWPSSLTVPEKSQGDGPGSATTLAASDWTYAPYSNINNGNNQSKFKTLLSSNKAAKSARRSKTLAPICGLPRNTFIIIAVIIAFLIALITGLAVGLGLTQVNLRKTQSNLAALSSSTSGIPTATATSTSAAPSATTKLQSDCPGLNGTTYTSTSSGKQFRRLCGVDYAPPNAVDIGSERTISFSACIDACAASPGCTGCGWGHNPQETTPVEGGHVCYLKSNLTKSHAATTDWAFSVLVEGQKDFKVANMTALFHEVKSS